VIRNIAKTIAIAFTATEVTLILVLIILEFASGYRAGIMHHLYFQKRHYLATLYQQSTLIYHVLGGVVSAWAIFFFRRSGWGNNGNAQLVRYWIVFALLVLCYLLPWVTLLNIYAHLLIVLECCLVLETIRILLLFRPY